MVGARFTRSAPRARNPAKTGATRRAAGSAARQVRATVWWARKCRCSVARAAMPGYARNELNASRKHGEHPTRGYSARRKYRDHRLHKRKCRASVQSVMEPQQNRAARSASAPQQERRARMAVIRARIGHGGREARSGGKVCGRYASIRKRYRYFPSALIDELIAAFRVVLQRNCAL